MTTLVSVSIVIFNQDFAELSSCVRALAASFDQCIEFYPDANFRIYIICNDEFSLDIDKIEFLKNEVGGSVDVISGQGNVGYGRGHNLVLNRDLGKYHLIVNADVLVKPETIKVCIDWMESHNRTVLVTGNGYSPEGKYLYLSKRFPDLRSLAIRSLGLDKKSQHYFDWTRNYIYADLFPVNKPVSIQIASGCFMFVRTNTFKVVGGFNPKYFLYFEDFDLSLRFGKLGDLFLLPFSITHTGGGAAKKGATHVKYFCVSALKFFFRYGFRLYR